MPDLITLVCPSCGGRTSYTAGSRRVTCQYCGNEHIFQFNDQPELTPREWLRVRPRQPRPRSVRLEQKNGELRLSWRWFAPKYIPMAFFCVAWDSFLIFWYSMAFGSGAPWIFIVFPIAHLAVGVGLTYATLAGFFNVTTLRLTSSTFKVQHDPFPWPGKVNVPVGQLQQFYCRTKTPRSSSGSTTYQLVGVLQGDRQIELVSNLDSPDIAWFLEQQMEAYLHIQDTPMAGELMDPA
ncbi:MAG: hypothetical protein ACK2UW_09115 [Anaerolineales bacterium]|jgi:hypothetical protein